VLFILKKRNETERDSLSWKSSAVQSCLFADDNSPLTLLQVVSTHASLMVRGMLSLLTVCPHEVAHLRKELLIAARCQFYEILLLLGWVETNPSNNWQHPYLTSAKAVSVVP
jgi:hypothetical protein